jgi:hypothetical protein
MKRTLVAALALLAFAGSAHAGLAPKSCLSQTPDEFAAALSQKTGKEVGAMVLPAKQFATAMALFKSQINPSLHIDGAAFMAGGGKIFLVITTKGKVCSIAPIEPKMANAIAAGDPALADKPDTPPASSHEKKFEHHDTTES